MAEELWMAIVRMESTRGVRPLPITDGLNVSVFENVQAIRELKERHPLRHLDWWAFNWETGESTDV